jgi:multimeric flavodoxin WrbA
MMIDDDIIALLGSARSDGKTRRAIEIAFNGTMPILDLQHYTISPYDYNNGNRSDDFLHVIDSLLAKTNIVLATPVYWYAMSAQLKIFFDRLSDLITIEKQRGRALAGKNMWLIVTGTDTTLSEGFVVPFIKTAAYFNMQYQKSCYVYTGDDALLRQASEQALQDFGRTIAQQLATLQF